MRYVLALTCSSFFFVLTRFRLGVGDYQDINGDYGHVKLRLGSETAQGLFEPDFQFLNGLPGRRNQFVNILREYVADRAHAERLCL